MSDHIHAWCYAKTVWAYDNGTSTNPAPHLLFYCSGCLAQCTRREELPPGGIRSRRTDFAAATPDPGGNQLDRQRNRIAALEEALEGIAERCESWETRASDVTLAWLGERAREALAAATPPAEEFCGRTDLEQHTGHHWWRLPDGSYGDEGEGYVLVRCPGATPAAEETP